MTRKKPQKKSKTVSKQTPKPSPKPLTRWQKFMKRLGIS